MSYSLKISEQLEKKLQKLAKRDKTQVIAIGKKVKQILQNPLHFKPLRGDMFGARRVHVAKSFVLTYDVDEEGRIVKLLDYDNHDNIY